MNTSARRAGALCVLAAATSLASPLAAQTSKRDALPSEQYAVSPGGVDMRTGQYTYSHTDLSLGGSTGMSLIRDNGANDLNVRKPFGSFAHNWDVYVNEKQSGAGYNQETGQTSQTSYHISVTAGGRSHSFSAQYLSGSIPIASTTAFAKLESVGTGSTRYYRYTASDGTVITFRAIDGGDCRAGLRNGKCAYASQIREPNGAEYDLEYEHLGPGPGARLRRVTSNFGYALIFEYGAAAGQEKLVTRACAVNTALLQLGTANTCPSGSRAATYTYHANGQLASATDAGGAVHSFTSGLIPAWQDYEYDVRFFRPGESAPYLTNRIVNTGFYEAVKKQTFADGRTFDYVWNEVVHNEQSTEVAGGSWSRNGGGGATIAYQTFTWPSQDGKQVGPGPSTITDSLGRVTKGDYCYPHVSGGGCVAGPVRSWTWPELNSIHYVYDGRRNVIETRRKAKPGSGLADIVTRAWFDCSTQLLCAKPQWTEDARGNRTVYTYHSGHGGVLTETGPAVNGVSPQKRYFYEQRSATLAGGAAADPVWLLVRESVCKTGNALGGGCAVSGDEVATTYEYGRNLQLKARVLDAGGLNLRTCYGYDTLGNQISETAPRAGLSTCP